MELQHSPDLSAKYGATVQDQEDLARRFTYHQPKDDQPERYNRLRATGRTIALMFLENCPPSRERSLALTKLEESIMWANAAIARNE